MVIGVADGNNFVLMALITADNTVVLQACGDLIVDRKIAGAPCVIPSEIEHRHRDRLRAARMALAG